jgi:hypothetical protein
MARTLVALKRTKITPNRTAVAKSPAAKNYLAIANRDCLILDGIGEIDIVTRNDFHG